MHLLPHERDKLLLYHAGSLAQRRLARGLRLNLAEATALLAWVLQERARDGDLSVGQLMAWGKGVLGRVHVLGDVPHLLHEVMVEATLPDGSFLVTVHDPIATAEGSLARALHGSALPPPDPAVFAAAPPGVLATAELPGAVVVPADAPAIVLHPRRARLAVRVTNTGDRPVQVGSHYHFIETNPALSFPRLATLGKKLDIAAGTAVRFEPGDVRTVALVAVGGQRPYLAGGNGVATGFLDELEQDLPAIAARLRAIGVPPADVQLPPPAAVAAPESGRPAKAPRTDDVRFSLPSPPPATLTREAYVALYGPTVGDRVRLADTELWLEVEEDRTAYGDECKFGGGKVLRDGMGQASGAGDADTLDTVLLNALILDWSGVIKADIGVKGGRIAGIGKAGNPGLMDAVTPGMVVGSCTDVIAAEGMIVTAGGLDSHVHYICPDLFPEALATGITTLIGGGTGPTSGTSATTCTPGGENVRRMLQATDGVGLNFVFTGKGNDSSPIGLRAQVAAGCGGLKVHEDWGTTPAVIDTCLTVCDELDVQCLIHTDTLNESSFVERTVAAFKGRTIHAYHSEGAGGGHAPDIIRVAGEPNVLPSSTNPTRPYAHNTLDEHLDMLMVCHHLSRNIAEDVAFADSRIRAETVAAEDVLQDMGALSIISSDSQAMGRIGEVVSRTWRTAAKMRSLRGPLRTPPPGLAPDVPGRDNARARRYVAKYTINPAVAQGMSHLLGSVEVGKLADLVLYKPAYFGTKPEIVLKGGQIAWAQMGDANGSIATVQPIYGRPMFGTFPEAAHDNSIVFVSKLSIDNGTIARYGLKKHVEPIRNCRSIGKKDMKLNDYLPVITVDPETYDVRADGELMTVPAATQLPLTTRSHFF